MRNKLFGLILILVLVSSSIFAKTSSHQAALPKNFRANVIAVVVTELVNIHGVGVLRSLSIWTLFQVARLAVFVENLPGRFAAT